MTASDHSNPMIVMVDEIIRLGSRLRAVFAGSTAASGLSSMESMVLAAVTEAKAPPTVPQIGRSLGHPRQVIQRAANELLAAGLIQAAPNPNHKRAPLLLATSDGEKLKGRVDAHAAEAANALLAVVDAAKCERLAQELHELRGKIEAHLRSRNG